jgi:hypothetical protein
VNEFNKPTNPPAFPNESNAGNIWNDKGMTLRDYFAAKAMQGLLSSDVNAKLENFAKQSYKVADAMLKAREA